MAQPAGRFTYQGLSAADRQRVDSLCRAMSLEEKVGQMFVPAVFLQTPAQVSRALYLIDSCRVGGVSLYRNEPEGAASARHDAGARAGHAFGRYLRVSLAADHGSTRERYAGVSGGSAHRGGLPTDGNLCQFRPVGRCEYGAGKPDHRGAFLRGRSASGGGQGRSLCPGDAGCGGAGFGQAFPGTRGHPYRQPQGIAGAAFFGPPSGGGRIASL